MTPLQCLNEKVLGEGEWNVREPIPNCTGGGAGGIHWNNLLVSMVTT